MCGANTKRGLGTWEMWKLEDEAVELDEDFMMQGVENTLKQT